MAYLAGDTIRLSVIVKNLEDEQEAPASITITIYRADKTTKVIDSAEPQKKEDSIAEYYYDFAIPALPTKERLVAVWKWSGPHQKKINIDVEPAP